MCPIVEVENVTFTYKSRPRPTLRGVRFSLEAGEFALLTGPSGCGKSTALKLLNGLIPHESGGALTGSIRIGGIDTRCAPVAALSRQVGLVFQSPEDQIFAATVYDEVAFVLENMGLEAAEVAARVAEALAAVDLTGLEQRSIHALSGGQKQRLAVAAVLAARPRVLALDEPISQLDPVNAQRLLELLVTLNERHGIAVLLVEHRLHEALRVAKRVLIMSEGELVWDGPAAEALAAPEVFLRYGLRLPQTVDICRRLQIPLRRDDNAEAARLIAARYAPLSAGAPPVREEARSLAPRSIEAERLVYAYESGAPPSLCGVDFAARRGEIVALMGTNGAGKSTLLQQIAGVLRPGAGRVAAFGAGGKRAVVGFVMQNPDFMLFSRTVEEELLFGPTHLGLDLPAARGACPGLLAQLALEGLEAEFPLALSRGQRLRVALASVLSCAPDVLLLDEPTTGQDISRIEDILALVSAYAAGGGTVLFCTHDTEVAASLAHRVVLMKEGEVIADGAPRRVFGDAALCRSAGLRQPAAAEIAQRLGAGALLSAEEVVRYVQQAGCGGYAV